MEGKAAQIVAASATFMNYAAGMMKKDNKIYKQKNKQMINNFVRANQEALCEYDKVRALLTDSPELRTTYEKVYKEMTGEEIEYTPELADDELNLVQDLFGLFVKLFIKANDGDLANMFSTLSTMDKGGRIVLNNEMPGFVKGILDQVTQVDYSMDYCKELAQNMGYKNMLK